MSRLGYVLAQSRQGFEPLAFSDDKYKRKIVDSRVVCSEFDQAFGAGSDFYEYLMFGDDEAYLYVAMPLKSSRAGDCISVMTVVPSNVKVSGVELKELVSNIKDALGKNSSTALTQTLNSLFVKDYPDREFQFRSGVKPSASTKFAYRQFGGTPYSLPEILDKLFQPYYYGYRAIFLTEKSPVAGGDAGAQVVSLTKEEIKEYVNLKFAPHTNVGIAVCVLAKDGSRQVFNPGDVLPFVRHSKVSVIYERPPFISCRADLDLNEDVLCIQDAKDRDWKLTLRRDMFQVVTSNKGRELQNAKVFVNSREVDGISSFSEKELKSAVVKATCTGYSGSPYKCNLLDRLTKPPLRIPLDDATRAFEIDGTNIKFTLPRDARIDLCSPLRGYDVKKSKPDGTTVLTYKPLVANIDVRRAAPTAIPQKPRRRFASILKVALEIVIAFSLGVAATLAVEYAFFDGNLPFGKAATESVKHGAGSYGGKTKADKSPSSDRLQKDEASGSESASEPVGHLVPDQAKEPQKEKGNSPDASGTAQSQDAAAKCSAEAAK
ncbi:MAG: hypothetical protein ACI35Q_04315 [Marinilabiliaceae bacterium]